MKTTLRGDALINALQILLVLVLLAAYPIAYKMSSETIEIQITEKERITTGKGEELQGRFIIFSKNEVFENTDSYLYLKFNSADYQNKFTVGKTYKVKVAGWRVPFLSMYRNIVSENN